MLSGAGPVQEFSGRRGVQRRQSESRLDARRA